MQCVIITLAVKAYLMYESIPKLIKGMVKCSDRKIVLESTNIILKLASFTNLYVGKRAQSGEK